MKKITKRLVSMTLTAAFAFGMLTGVQAQEMVQSDIVYDFEDGTTQGWQKGKVWGSSEVTVETEGENKFLRLKTLDTGAYMQDNTKMDSNPDAYVTMNYEMPANSDIMLSTDFRYSDTSSSTIDFWKQFLINSYKNELPYINGNVYKLWEIRADKNFRTYSSQSTGTVWWDNTTYQGAASQMKDNMSHDTWYTMKTIFKTDGAGMINKASYFLYDKSGNVIASSLNETVANWSLKTDKIEDLSILLANFTGNTRMPEATFDIDNVMIKNVTGMGAAALVEDKFTVSKPELKIQLGEKIDSIATLSGITCKNAAGASMAVESSFDVANNQIIIKPTADLARGNYTITIPGTVTVLGNTLDTTSFTFKILNSEDVTFDFEDGLLGGWTKSKAQNTKLTVEMENDNKFLRLQTKESGPWVTDNTVSSTANATVGINYKMPANSKVLMSTDFRFTDPSITNTGKKLINYDKKFLINSVENEMPRFGGNVYEAWMIRYLKSLETYSEQTTDKVNGAVYWNKELLQGAAKKQADVSAGEWYTIKTVYTTDAEGVITEASYFLYDANGNVVTSSINETVTNWSLQTDEIMDIGIALMHRENGYIPNQTYDIDNITIKALENNIGITAENAAECVYTNLNSLSEDVMCAVAVYEKTADGALILKKVELESQAVLPGKTWSATTKAVTGVAGNVVKAFLWKGNNEPVINGVEKTITAE